MLHVGIDATSWANDRGFGRFTRELVTALAARSIGFRYTLLFDRTPGDDIPPSVEIVSANTSRTLTESAVGTTSRSIGYLWRMGRLAREARFDVFFFPAVYSYFPMLARMPCIVCYHDTTAERFPELIFPTKLNRRLWQVKTALARFQTTRAMTVSQASAKDLEEILHIPKDRIDVVTEAADPVFRVIRDDSVRASARERYGIPAAADLLVHVGGLNPHKNLLALLKAMVDVVSRRDTVHLAIVGDTSGKGFWDNVGELRNFVQDHPSIQNHVRFTGFIPDSEMANLLNASDALIFPSLWEGFGLPAVEAMSCGLPVLASSSGSLPEVVGDAGLLFDPADPGAIAGCILRFMADSELRHRLAKSAVERVRLFSWGRAAELAEQSFHRCYEDARRLGRYRRHQ
jgi:alpha-1,3-rhamnosyl/mannosyltransferase